MKVIGVISSAVLSVGALALPLTAAADRKFESTAKMQVTTQLKEAKNQSYELRKSVDRLNVITRSGDLAWQSHASYLNSLRHDVNRLGMMFAALEEAKDDGSAPQRIAIENSKIRLQGAADSISQAIALLNDRTHNVHFSDYEEIVKSIDKHARSLHENLDAVVKLEDAKSGFEKLDLGTVAQI